MTEITRLGAKILYLAEDDWVPLGEADAYARILGPDPKQRTALLLEAVGQLIGQGLVEPGRIEPGVTAAQDFTPWGGTVEEQTSRLASVYTPEANPEDDWYYSCWLNITPAGSSVVAQLPASETEWMTAGEG